MAIILLASELFVNPMLFGQSISSYSDISSCLEEMYEDLTKTNAHTGYFSDQAVDLVSLRKYAGQALTDSNYVDTGIFRSLFITMNQARVSSTVRYFHPY